MIMSNNQELEREIPMSDDPNMYNSVYRELIDLIGIECTLKIYSQYNGQQLSFPKRLYTSSFIEQRVIEEYDGRNVKELARKYGYTERWVCEKIKRIKK